MRLASLLRDIRVDKGMNQTQLAHQLDRPQSYISRYETGQTRLDLPELRLVCEGMGISLQEIIASFEESDEA
ncbi:MAG: helix-turn-helix transcriptional regulator [Planctomycetia bacterium]|nr:helix-turn-helix transcriptional regulator [Planctomycetia bacterium]